MRASVRLTLLSGLVIGCVSFPGFASAATAFPHPTLSPAATPPPLYDSGSYWADPRYGTPQVDTIEIDANGAAVTFGGAVLTGPNAGSYSIVSNTCAGATVPSGGSCLIGVQLHATTVGPLPETLELTTSVGAYDIDLTATVQPAFLLVSPAATEFGFQPVGTTSAPKDLIVTNINPVPVSVDFFYSALAGPYDDFNENDQCAPVPANGTCTLHVTFKPTSAGPESAQWFITTGTRDDGNYQYKFLSFTGTGVLDSATTLSLGNLWNVSALGAPSGHTLNGGLDGVGNTYSREFFSDSLTYAGQTFTIGDFVSPDAVSGITLPVAPGPYSAVSMLATGVRGNQANQSVTLTYTDGTSEVLHQSFSDWHTPQHYAGESVALTMPYRLTADGIQHAGPYYLYAYTLPINHMKTLAGIKLPGRTVVILAANLELNGVPTTVGLHDAYNVGALYPLGPPIPGPGIDGLGDALANDVYYERTTPLQSIFDLNFTEAPNGVANTVIALPQRTFSRLDLLATGVRGNHANQTLSVTYTDGTSTVLHQSFSDTHTSQAYPGETVGIAMPYRLNPDGTKHPGVYNVYQYRFALDASKVVASLTLPKTVNIVTLAVSLEP